MQYYRNSELAHLYSVSRSAVGKWVEAARAGKLDLTLVDDGDKSYIANTAKNHAAIKAMVPERKKYFNKRSLKIVTPKPEFYTIYSPKQVADIVSNIQIHGEIPRQYNYLDGGADSWDKYAQRLYDEDLPNMLNSTARLLETNRSYLDDLLNAAQLVAFAGLDPRINQSGPMHATGRITKRGSPFLRHYLYMAAMKAERLDPELQSSFERRRARGKSYQVATVHIARKLVHRLYAVLNSKATHYTKRQDGHMACQEAQREAGIIETATSNCLRRRSASAYRTYGDISSRPRRAFSSKAMRGSCNCLSAIGYVASSDAA